IATGLPALPMMTLCPFSTCAINDERLLLASEILVMCMAYDLLIISSLVWSGCQMRFRPYREQSRPTHARRRAMRSLEAIASDVRNGKVSRAAAERDYGVERVRAALNS